MTTLTNPAPTAAIVDEVAARLADPDAVTTAATARGRRSSLAGGAIGIALLHIERARSGHGDEATMHRWLTHAAGQPVSSAADANLFHGAPALAFVLHCAAAGTGRYRRPLAALDDAVHTLTRTRLDAASARLATGEPPLMREFDLVHGLTGLGVYHLSAHPHHPITRDVLAYLVRLTQPICDTAPRHGSTRLPPWWMPVALSGEPDPTRFPHGHANLGVAHGMSAVIALFSLAVLRGVDVAGSRDALTALCAWTDQWRQGSPAVPWWPGYLTLTDEGAVAASARPRSSWCYGIAGTARAQQLAGLALADTGRTHQAEHAILAALRRPQQHDLLPEMGLCHGTAGLLQAAWRTADTSSNPHLAAELPGLAAQLTTQLHQRTSDPELMDGAAGAALAVHTVATGRAPASGWDAFLLLS